MKTISQQLNDNNPMFIMRDVYEALVGKAVCIFTLGPIPLGGIVENAYSGILTISTANGTIYIPKEKIVAIQEYSIHNTTGNL